MTYGWSLLAVIIVIAALAAFGVLNASKLLPDSCELSMEFRCSSFSAETDGDSDLDEDDKITIILSNDAAGSLSNFILSIDGCETPSEPVTLNNGDSQKIIVSGCELSEGSRFRGNMHATYDVISENDGPLSQSKSGKIQVTVG